MTPGWWRFVPADHALKRRKRRVHYAAFQHPRSRTRSSPWQLHHDEGRRRRTGAVYSAPAFTTPALFLHDPTYEEWSLALEQQLGSKTSVIITYAGNHGYHELVEDGQRNLTVSGGSANYFPTVPTTKPVTGLRHDQQLLLRRKQQFNGVVFTAARRAKNLAVQFNYEFSKALDEVSNGGLEPFAPDAGDAENR